MRLVLSTICFVVFLLHASLAEEESSWSWGADKKTEEVKNVTDQTAEISGRSLGSEIFAIDDSNLDEIIDDILEEAKSSRQGRNLDEGGYGDVYTDPDLKQAIENGDNVEARSIIKDKLCSLGLMRCDYLVKRPYVSPDQLIYAQPVALKPVGRPIASIPVHGPPRGYGPPKPMPIPHHPPNTFGPPRPSGNGPPRRGYGPPFKPTNNGGHYYEASSGSFSSSPNYQPIEPAAPYDFVNPTHHKQKLPVEVVIAQGGSSQQQHVHHHYHHGSADDVKVPTVLVNNPLSVGSHGHIHSTGSSFETSGFAPNNFDSSYTAHKDTTAASFGNANNGLGSYAGGIRPISESFGAQTFGSTGSGTYAGSFGANSFGTSVGSYGNSSPFYKKELNINKPLSGNSLHTSTGQLSYADKYRGFESNRNENYDCICVPYDQCPAQDIIGRKDDLYLALDPRSLKSDIEAISDEVVVTDGNGTMSVVRVPKEASEKKDNENNKSEETKKVSKREAPNDKKDETKDKSKIEPRLISNYGNKQSNIQPTFGVSFGLPQGGGGYPLNPFSPNPFANPYGNVIGGGGINLGLVSVNPLVSIQVTKDEDGEKIIKPLVNLHVTPNDFLVQKVGSFLHHKKEALHHHVHEHNYPRPPPHYYGHHKPIYHGPPHSLYGPRPPVHGPPSSLYGPPPPIHGPPSSLYGPPSSLYGPPQSIYRPPSSHNDLPLYPPHNAHSQYYDSDSDGPSYYDDTLNNYGGGFSGGENAFYGRALNDTNENILNQFSRYISNQNSYNPSGISNQNSYYNPTAGISSPKLAKSFSFPKNRRRRDTTETVTVKSDNIEKRQAYYGNGNGLNKPNRCGPRHVCCKRPLHQQVPIPGNGLQCGKKHAQGITGRVKTPQYIDGDSEFGEYPWQVAILKKDPKESVYVCGGTLIDSLHILTAAHCVKTYSGFDLRVRLGEWDVNHDVEFYPYIERDIQSVTVHPEFYAGTLYNDLAVLRMNSPVDWTRSPHISPACLPDPYTDYTGTRCWTTGWGKDAFGEYGKYQNILKEVDVPIVSHGQCQNQMKQTRLGYDFKLHPGFICAGGEEGKDACKGDGGGPMVCEHGGSWKVVGVVSWGIGCGHYGVPGVYVKVAHYLDWIKQVTNSY